MSESTESIYDLFQKVRQHPDFLFGTIFTTDDIEGRQPRDTWIEYGDGESRMVEAGNDVLDDMFRHEDGEDEDDGL